MSTASSAQRCSLCQVSNPSMICNCASPGVPLCQLCLMAHIAVPGHHMLSAAPKPQTQENPTQNMFCQLCTRCPPNLVCPCRLPPVALCKSCIADHLSKNPVAVHTFLSMDALPYITSQRYPQELCVKKEKIEAGKALFEKYLQDLSEAENYVEQVIASCIEKLQEVRVTLRSEIDSMKDQVMKLTSDIMQDLEGNVFDIRYSPNDEIGRMILNAANLTQELQLLSIEKLKYELPRASDLLKLTLKVPKNPSNSAFEATALACVFPDTIQKYDCVREGWCGKVALSERIGCDSGSCLCYVEDNKVFLSGRYAPTSSSAYFINTDSGVVAKMPNMTTARCQHGMIFTRGHVYVFGGFTKNKNVLTQCEKFSLTAREWLPLPNLATGKNCFNPCLLRTKIYLTGGTRCPTTEVFDLDTETLSAVNLNLPVNVGNSRSDSTTCSFVDSEEVVILRIEGEYRFKGRLMEDAFRVKKFEGMYPWSNSAPVVVNGQVYTISFWLKQVAKYDTRASKWSKL